MWENLEKLLSLAKYVTILLILYIVINFLTPMATSFTSLRDRLAPAATAEVVTS